MLWNIFEGFSGYRGCKVAIYLFDDCCFSGGKTSTYGSKVRSIVRNLGVGEYELYMDGSHNQHKISQSAIDLIDKTISEVSKASSD